MRSSRRPLALLACSLCAVLAASGSEARAPAGTRPAAPAGERAPFFALPAVAGGGLVESDTLFEANALTMLAFWTTHCAECVRRLEICQELQDWGAPEGLAVVGVNFDETPSGRMELLVRETTPRVLQLYDAGGRTASLYGAGAHSFSVYLIDDGGTIRDAFHEIAADSLARLRSRLRKEIEGAYAEVPAPPASPSPEPWLLQKPTAAAQRFELHGVGRVRWMDVDTTGTGATGPFGEALDPGSSLRHRLELELVYAVTPQLRVGGLVWLSNEGEAVLRSGPDYLSAPWGSAFARYDASTRLGEWGNLLTSLRAGYYHVYWTPLTLMRWDANDSPISGGQRVQGCGVCGGEAGLAGFIRAESVEKLAPEYLFEGGHATLSFAGRLDLTALYARPHMHWPEHSYEIPDAADPGFYGFSVQTRYRQEIYGARLTAHLPFAWSPDPAALSGNLLFVRDDEEDWPWTGIHPPYAPGTDRLAGANLRLPMPWRIEIDGELVQSRWEPVSAPGFEDPQGSEGTAFLARGALDVREKGGSAPFDLLPAGMRISMQAAYARIGTDFFSPYSALSYEANVHPSQQAPLPGFAGPRATARIEWGPVGLGRLSELGPLGWVCPPSLGPFGLGVFYKKLAPIDEEALNPMAEPGGERRLASFWADATIWPGVILTVGWVKDDRDPLPLQTTAPQERRRIWVVGLEQELATRASLLLECQWSEGEDEGEMVLPSEEEHSSRTLRVMVDAEF